MILERIGQFGADRNLFSSILRIPTLSYFSHNLLKSVDGVILPDKVMDE